MFNDEVVRCVVVLVICYKCDVGEFGIYDCC